MKDVKNRFESICLKFNNDTPFMSYNYSAYIGGALLADKKFNAYPYYLSNHILLMSNNIFNVSCDDMVMFRDKNVFVHKSFPKGINKKEEIKDFLINMLIKGYYISATVDEFYIPNRESYQIREFYHDLLIYGFNLSKNLFYTAGYDKSEYFSLMECDIDVTLESIHKCLLERHSKPHFHFFKPRACEKDFDLEKVKKSLKNYLNSKSDNYRRYNAYYGLEAYDNLINEYRYMHKINGYWRKASFSMLKEHKRLMKERLCYMQSRCIGISDELIEQYDSICNEARVVEMQALKYDMVKNDKNLEKVCDKIKRMSEHEEKAINKILFEL